MTTYYATLELDPRSGQWMADIEGLPVHTWGRTLAKVKKYAHEALAVHLDIDTADACARLVFRKPELPSSVLKAIEDAEAARTEADTAAARAAEAKAAAAQALVREAHLSMRDAAEVLVYPTSASNSSSRAESEQDRPEGSRVQRAVVAFLDGACGA